MLVPSLCQLALRGWIAKDVTSFSGVLPQSGFYMIEVGSTGGVAQYTLNVTG